MEDVGAGLSGDASLGGSGFFGFLISGDLLPKLVQEVVLLRGGRRNVK